MLDILTQAPNFTLPDQDGIEHTLSDYKGEFVLLYFYPKDDTPGCTREACSIRDVYGEFEKAGVKVFGVNKDSVKSHKKFSTKYSLPFTLLSDEDKVVIELYKANRVTLGTKRVSYLINPKGLIIKAYKDVTPDKHADEVLQDILTFK